MATLLDRRSTPAGLSTGNLSSGGLQTGNLDIPNDGGAANMGGFADFLDAYSAYRGQQQRRPDDPRTQSINRGMMSDVGETHPVTGRIMTGKYRGMQPDQVRVMLSDQYDQRQNGGGFGNGRTPEDAWRSMFPGSPSAAAPTLSPRPSPERQTEAMGGAMAPSVTGAQGAVTTGAAMGAANTFGPRSNLLQRPLSAPSTPASRSSGSFSGGQVTNTGASGFNAGGVRALDTTSGPATEYDPRKDLTKTFLQPGGIGGDLLPKGASGGVMINPKYRTPGASAIGSVRFGGGGPMGMSVETGRGPAAPVAPQAAASNPGANVDARRALAPRTA